MTALSVILKIFSFKTPIIRIGFEELPILFTGFFLGPIWGMAAGGVSDIIGVLVNGGKFFPGFTVSAILIGAIPGLFTIMYKKEFKYLSLFGIVALTQVLTSVILNTLWLDMMGHGTFMIMLPGRTLEQLILIPLYTTIILLLDKKSRHIHSLHAERLRKINQNKK